VRDAAIYVCSLYEMPRHAAALMPSHVMSLVSPAEMPDTPPNVDVDCHLRLALHDIGEPMPGYICPDYHHIEELIDFARDWDATAPLLVHCFAGISRSTAATLIVLCLRAEGREAAMARALRKAAPHALPNRRIVALADEVLGRDGRLIAAVGTMGPATLAASGPLTRVPLPLDDDV
jgi:predicted protein tyrosine phosphatase